MDLSISLETGTTALFLTAAVGQGEGCLPEAEGRWVGADLTRWESLSELPFFTCGIEIRGFSIHIIGCFS